MPDQKPDNLPSREDAANLPPAARPGYLDCAEAAARAISWRILLGTGMQEACNASILDRLDQLRSEGRFEPLAVSEPAYRFRPLRLPFAANEATAMDFYRTEQSIKELCARLATYGCLDGRYGLAMAAEAEACTDGLAHYALRAGEQVAPMDRDGLRAGLARLINAEAERIKRLLFVRALDRLLPPEQARLLGAAGLRKAFGALLQEQDNLERLLALTGEAKRKD